MNEGIQLDSTYKGTTIFRNSKVIENVDQKLSHLQDQEKSELKQLLCGYKHLFPDVPTRTNKIFHDVEIVDSKPIKQYPYRMKPLKQQYMKNEIQLFT